MIVTIWRHGEAGSARTDRERELTARGRDDVDYGAERFLGLCADYAIAAPELILFSRWVRTTQTAGILAGHLPQARSEPCEALIPGSRSAGVDVELERRLASAAPVHILLVSHQPLVSTLVDHYLGEPGRVAPLVPGGMASLELAVPAAACGQLVFSAQPPQYEAMP